MLANGSEAGSNSDSTSSDLPMLKGKKAKSMIGGSDLAAKSLYSRKKDSPSSPPPLLPPDLSLGSRSFVQRPKSNKASETNWFARRKSDETKATVKKGNDWY